MDRRGFLSLLGLGVGGLAIDQAIPLGRVWSFPKEIVVAQPNLVRFVRAYSRTEDLMVSRFDAFYGFEPMLGTGVGCEAHSVIKLLRPSQLQEALDFLAQKHGVVAPPAIVLAPVYRDPHSMCCGAEITGGALPDSSHIPS